MLGTYYYHEIIRRTIISFGTLFNNIEIKHKTQAGDAFSTVKVPIAYGPTEKFVARLEQRPDLRNRVAITLPRLSFEMDGITYDATRKVSTMQTFKAFTTDGSKSARKVFMPVPYNLSFKLYAMTQYNEDSLQIIEQILPFFQPSFNLSVNLVSSIGEKRDIPMVLDSVNFEDNYESGMDEKRIIIHTLGFTAKTFLFGPVADSSSGLIKKVQVDYNTNTTNRKESSRQLRYIAEPRALKDYNDDGVTTLGQDIDKKVKSFLVSDTSSLSTTTYIAINNELMYITAIDGNKITVRRGEDGTLIDTHISGTNVDAVNAADDALVELGDDFGFSEQRFDFGDGKIYSPTKGVDV